MTETVFPKIHLRALEPEDLSLLYTIENDAEMWDISASSTPISKYALKQYLALQPQDVYQSGELRLVIEHGTPAEALGLLDLTDISFRDGRAEVGIAVLREKRGQGFGLAALYAIETYAKTFLRLRLLYAHVSAGHNQISQKLFKRAGYENVALLPEWKMGSEGVEDVLIFQKKL